VGGLLETGDDDPFQRPLDQLFNIFQLATFVMANQRERFTFHAGTTRAADAVHIIFRDVRQLVIDDVGQRIDIDAARRDIGGHQRNQLAFLEIGQGARPGALRLVTMDGG
jgi:hypothetical protein